MRNMKTLQEKVDRINNLMDSRCSLTLDKAYGSYRVGESTKEGRVDRYISARYPLGAMWLWLEGFEDALKLQEERRRRDGRG